MNAARLLCRARPCVLRSHTQLMPQISTRLAISTDKPKIDPVQHRREVRRADPTHSRRSIAQDISTTPTKVVRVSNLPPGTTATDIRHSLGLTDHIATEISAVHFEFDFNLRALHSCRVEFFNTTSASEFALHASKKLFAGRKLQAVFVTRKIVPNPTRDKYIGNSLGRVVFLYGYPQHVHKHQVWDYYRSYDLVDTTLPGVQQAPQIGETFLVRRGAFLLHFATEAEARRFVRDVYGSTYISKTEDSGQPKQEYTLKARILQ
ncbi:hypothetical protein LPJ77_002796 [Coemansia sp. RSA 2523]|nr:hypothetical protein LPJ54_002431 [Coemansia sp. RSA 1824]KAJ1807783.1 hypothetical protein LPJ77_002796 [Coemansia sp. RSA 2523]KAJ2129075.1 hypothetical protein GGH17_004208 [Coemansia sp. RSA 788]KAJ2153649.1 hypothetical protein J3F82_001812 [Coemansia sp. RSA 637]KAJ2554025.1 hypothetical protein IWW35_001506 [Coemansia sp. RSA 1878]